MLVVMDAWQALKRQEKQLRKHLEKMALIHSAAEVSWLLLSRARYVEVNPRPFQLWPPAK